MNILQWRTALERARGVLILAGAGMGVDSGLPDFRGSEGFWKAYPPIAQRGLSFPEVSTPWWFDTDPEFAWGFFGHRYGLYTRAVPHEGFSQLLEVAQQKPEGYFVVTSNVDGQFQKAGYDPERIFEVHGSIHYWQCRRSCRGIWEAEGEIQVNQETFRAEGQLPRCPKCNAIARPNILMFDDNGFRTEREYKQNERYTEYVRQLRREMAPHLIVEIGAGTAVPTIRATSEHLLDLLPQAFLVRINPRDTAIPGRFKDRSCSFPMRGLEGIAQLTSGIDN